MVSIGRFVLGSPEQNSNFAPVYENEAFALVGHVGAKATAHDAVPSGQIHLVKLCLDDLCDVVKDTALLECESHAVNRVLLHKLIHISVLYHCIFSLLLIRCSMGLNYLRIRLFLPLFSLVGTSVSCNLRNCLGLHLHFLFLLL